MSVAFQCPSCLRNLEFSSGESAFQICPYCKGKIIVPSTTVNLEQLEERKPTDYALREQKDFILAEVRRELDAGRKIQAIKVFRESFGTGLKEAKDAVELMERGGKIDISKAALRQSYSALPGNPADQKIYQVNPGQPPAKTGARAGTLILWLLIAIGIVLFIIFRGN